VLIPCEQPTRDRRGAAIFTVLLVWSLVSLLQWQPRLQPALWTVVVVLTLQALRMACSHPTLPQPQPLNGSTLPTVSIIIPAQNEAAVLPALIVNLFQLNYPAHLLEIWIVDDGSTDETAAILTDLQSQYPALKVWRRQAQGGKSGALNALWPLTQTELILICDADAQLPVNFLEELVPLCQGKFQGEPVAAVQVRKTTMPMSTLGANHPTAGYLEADNIWLRCLEWELSCDAVLQVQRMAVGGLVEFRGNGMLIQRDWLEQCGGWSEDTVTDDLDLTFKLQVMGAKLLFVTQPVVQEEGVTTWAELWRQRCRWAEGGYLRYFDYWSQLLGLPWFQKLDLALFFGLQFLLPIGLIPDLCWTVLYSHRSILWPLQILFGVIVTTSFVFGSYQFQQLRGLKLVWATLQGSVYMLHWIPIMVLITFRTCLQRHPSPWHKTRHHGLGTPC
jgi:1,2-diacylglycerol 3-beta-glucosyltransferase